MPHHPEKQPPGMESQPVQQSTPSFRRLGAGGVGEGEGEGGGEGSGGGGEGEGDGGGGGKGTGDGGGGGGSFGIAEQQWLSEHPMLPKPHCQEEVS